MPTNEQLADKLDEEAENTKYYIPTRVYELLITTAKALRQPATDAGPTNEEIVEECKRQIQASGEMGMGQNFMANIAYKALELAADPASWHKPAPVVDELLPCPFCGCAVENDEGKFAYHPESNCCMSDDYNTITAWNTRAQALRKEHPVEVPESVRKTAEIWAKYPDMEWPQIVPLAKFILGLSGETRS